jgi:transposase-like protein
MVLDRAKLKKLLREKGVKSLDDFNAFMRDVSKDVVETLLAEELTDHLGFEKHDQKAKTVRLQAVSGKCADILSYSFRNSYYT